MMNAIVLFFRFLFSHKWKILLTALLSVFFLIVLFPLSDLNDFISSYVSKMTNNQIYVQFDKMHLSPISTSVALENVLVETPQINALTSDELHASPSISALLARKPGGNFTAKGILKGDLDIKISPTKSDTGVDKSKIEILAEKLSIKEIKQVANLTLPIKGELNLTAQAVADLTFTEQPDVDLTLLINKFEMANSQLALQDLGQISLPEIKLSKIDLKGKLNNGKFIIESGKLGGQNDEFYGDIKGDMGLTFQNMGGQIVPILGGYNLILDLKAQPTFKEKAKFFLSFLDGYKIEAGKTTNYKFRVQSAGQGMPPQFTAIK